MKVGCEAAPTNRSVPAKHASKMLYLLCNLVPQAAHSMCSWFNIENV